jgi:hypothetical protein
MRIVYLVLVLLVAIFLGIIWTIADDQAQSLSRITTPTSWQLSRPTQEPGLGQYSFQPGPNVRFVSWDAKLLEATAILDGQSIRWMTRSDEGERFPKGARTLHVTIQGQTTGSELGEAFTYIIPPFEPLRLDRQTRQDTYLFFPGTKDYRGLPLRMTCHLGAQERRALEEFGILVGMQQGNCSFRSYVKPDIAVHIEPFPVERLAEAHLVLPPFFAVVRDSLVRRKATEQSQNGYAE